jgi:hypothetical protein
MARQNEQLSPERLCDAAEAALRAAVEVAAQHGGVWPYPADLMGAENQPECLCQFTKYEIEQASEFLVRLGMIEPPLKKR